jgi:hypothetical protein
MRSAVVARCPFALGVLLALSGCTSGPAPAPAPDGGADPGHDAGAPVGGVGGREASPQRTATRRSLLATSTRSLLLDPFVTADTSWGHFVGLLLPAVNGRYKISAPRRAYVSRAPGGVAAPVASIAAISTLDPAATGLSLVAPFPGGSHPFDAKIWVSAGDAAGMPVPFDTAAARLTVALLPNDLPSTTYPLAKAGPPVSFAGREWALLALPAAVPMPEGGWFSITVDDVHVTFQLQAPEVTPATATGPVRVTGVRRERDRAGVAAYVKMTLR